MKKIFISQPMNGKTNEEIDNEREKIIKHLKHCLNEDFEIIDSFFKDAPHEASPIWFLGESIKMMANADLVAIADGWEFARGCRVERQVALNYGIDIIYIRKRL